MPDSYWVNGESRGGAWRKTHINRSDIKVLPTQNGKVWTCTVKLKVNISKCTMVQFVQVVLSSMDIIYITWQPIHLPLRETWWPHAESVFMSADPLFDNAVSCGRQNESITSTSVTWRRDDDEQLHLNNYSQVRQQRTAGCVGGKTGKRWLLKMTSYR